MAIFDARPGFHRTWVYPLQVKGRFQSIRRWSMLALQAFFFIMPWLSIDGRRLLMLDIAERELHLFGLLFTRTLTSFFDDPMALWTGQASWMAYGAAVVFGGAAFADYAWFRDQFCSYLCPYARFQGALTDEESWVISYEQPRGEPRRRGKRQRPDQGACISCNKCVAVCPQGIDIRDGYQLECTSCARCVDACQGVMDKLGEPTLVRYSSEVEDQGGALRVLRPRTMVYTAIMLVLTAIFALLLAGRHELSATVSRAPGSMYQVDGQGGIRNTFTLQVENRSTSGEQVQVQVSMDGLEGAELIAIPMVLGEGESKTIPLVVTLPVDAERDRTLPFDFVVSTPEDSVAVGTSFKSGT